MKIAHVSDFYLPRLGGVEMLVDELSARQRAAGHEVTILTSTPGPTGSEHLAGDRADGSDACATAVIRLLEHVPVKSAFNPLGIKVALDRLAELNPDVVHCHAGLLTPLGYFVAHRAASRGLPVVVTVHSMVSSFGPILRALNSVGHWTDLPITWIAVSHAAAAELGEVLGPDTVIKVVANGIDQDDWRPMPTRPQRRTPEVLTLAAVMRLSVRKRPIPLLHMVAAARRELEARGADTRIRLLVAGDGSQLAPMRRAARRLGLTEVLDLRGRLDRDQVQALLGEADAFIAPADLESFGIAALEARCAGLPVIAKSSGGVGEFVTDGAEGLLCTTDDDMAAAIVRLACEPGLLRRMRRHNVEQDCPVHWPQVLEQTDRIYDQARVLAGHRPVLATDAATTRLPVVGPERRAGRIVA